MNDMTRRGFMTGTLTAGIGAGLAGALPSAAFAADAAAAPAADAGMKLGMVTYKMGEKMSVDELIDLCRQAGLAGVELRTTHAHKVEPDLSKEARAEVKKKFADSGIIIAGLGTTCEFHAKDDAVVRKQIETAKEFAQLAADIGCPGIKVRPNGTHKDEDVAKTIERIGKAWGEAAKFAGGLGVEVRMEVHGGEETRKPANIRKMLDIAAQPNATACWNCNGGEEDANGSIKANFEHLKGHIGLVHINDIGIPKYPWQELFTLLTESGYQGFCLAEMEGNEDPVRFMQYYRTLFDLYTGRYKYPNA
jgi:sugar phosphate isomerase/epimerase